MSTKPPTHSRRRQRPHGACPRDRRGFTLIELLTVVAILAVLMAMTLAIISYATKKGASVKTEAVVAACEAGLKRYFDRYGEYPMPVDNGGTGVGGAITLYQALNDDGSDQILGVGTTSSDGKAGADRIFDLVSEGHVGTDGQKYFVKDGYDHPLRYRVYDPANPDATNNKTYDIWSFAEDTDHENEATWIKNW